MVTVGTLLEELYLDWRVCYYYPRQLPPRPEVSYHIVGRAVPGLAGLLLLSAAAATTDRQARRSTDILPPVRTTPDILLHPERSTRQSLLPPPRGLGVANIVRITSENSAKLIGCSEGCTYFTASTRKYMLYTQVP
jgi:hypothetical protein